MSNAYISVTQLNGYINKIFKAEETLHNIMVLGEISGFKISGQHAYFTLKDQNAGISCCCFYYSKTYTPKDGESVICKGSPDFYAKGGRLSFNVTAIQPVGKGLLFMQIEELKKKLLQEGIFDDKHKIAIPKYASNICILTAKTGAVIRDIITTTRRKNSIIDIVVHNIKVQGDGSAQEIVIALNSVDKLGFDTIILARGGGSIEDLMSFNDEQVVRTIYNMHTPIISAVGHETDYTLCDFVADARAATPTAGAELAVWNYTDTINTINTNLNKINDNINYKISNYLVNLNTKSTKLIHLMSTLLDNKANLINMNCASMSKSVDKLYTLNAHKVENNMSSLDNLNPIRLLKSGYFRILKDNLSVFDISNISIGDNITAISNKGKVYATVDKVVLEDKQ